MKAFLQLDFSDTISEIDDRLYSSFIEQMGRAVYTGIYEPEHPASDSDGLRMDVLDLIRPLNLSHIRYPGGNFVSGYRWEDGVGPAETRPVRRDLAWSALETNEFGTNEFMKFCRKADVSPMMAVNLGTRGPQDAVNLLEYCNISSGTYYSDLRISHGEKEPHNIKLWCLGNEMDGPWQICAKTAEEYGRTACETAKMMKWMDPSVELVVCGSSYKAMPTFGSWERTVLRHCYEHVDYLSLHQYYQNLDGDIPSFLARSVEMDSFIDEVAGICREIKQEKGSDKDIYLSFDEWNIWYHFQKSGKCPEKWIKARPIEEEDFDFADSLLLGSMMNSLINHSDVVKIACLAQLVNVIAPIMTEPGGAAWTQTIYYPFYYASLWGRGTALKCNLTCPAYGCSVSPEVPYLDVSAVLSRDRHTLSVFIVNKNLEEDIRFSLELPDGICGVLRTHARLSGYAPDTVNTSDHAPVVPQIITSGLPAAGRRLDLTLEKASWNALQISI